ncbi:hypothetical protein Fleli_2122 [Bernardetia litoralis DSM 6794]|uniref:Ig-like domain-containing protein n=1 Tax=Bernardetia litoralis (strain ATCC 23117 / DSM 6794 / NBRC 15988 / NCIMB 1366 / Fx l1 / Sio-4) TaxID=880071 RepID=I4AKL9_BERLS|nr:T9SS type A sorting domain-containing protein [Bernardetia litoralis]AFM04504.1 hypothetical protein Fleli_2122 [Bernardetia litoralis DSM 6794]
MKHNYIYTLCLALSLLFISNFVEAQGETCVDATPFCVGIPIDYPAGTGGDATISVGPDYGCLFTQPNPAWFYLEMGTPGTVNLEIQNTPQRDIDFAIWGPFAPGSTVSAMCTQIFTGTLAPFDCSYSATINPETPSVTGTTGELFVMIITNFSNAQTDLTLTQSSGTGNTNCAVLCDVDAGADITTCGIDGTSVTLTADVANFTTGWTYQWYKDGVLIPSATNATYVVPTPNVTADVTNAYHVQATNPTLPCTSRDTVDVTITSASASFTVDAGADISRCDATGGLTLDVSHASHGATFTYQWSENGTPITGATNATLNVNFTSTGGNPVTRTYSITVSDPAGCDITDEVDVTFVPDPVVNLGTDIVACDAFGIVTLDAADASHGTTISYQWYEDGTIITGATNATLDVSFPSGGAAQTRTYRAEVTDSRGTGCTQADEVDVTFKPNIVVNLAPLQDRCENVFQFNINASDATHSTDMTYELFENGVLTVTSTSPIFTISIDDPTATTIQTRTYRVRATDNTGLSCTVTSNTVSVSYNYKPLIAPIADQIDVDCVPNQLTAQTSNYTADDNRLSYSWIYSGANNVQFEASTKATVLVNNSGTYTLTITTTLANGTTCSSVESFVLKCNEDPIPDYVPVLTGQAGYSYVDLQWTAIPEGVNISEFEVYMGINGEEPNVLLTLTSDNFLKVDLINGKKYSFRVRAVYLTSGGNNYEVGVYSNTIFLKPSIVLGQDETDKRAAISLFPNPSTGSFTLEFKAIQAQKANLTVVDLTGKVILTQSISDLNNGSQQNIELGKVASGVYIVQVQTEKGVYQQKITIVK